MQMPWPHEHNATWLAVDLTIVNAAHIADDISKLGGLQPDVSCSDFPKGGAGVRSQCHQCNC